MFNRYSKTKTGLARVAASLVLVASIFSPMQAANAETTYTITTKTGNKGTNADIMVKLFGTKGAWDDFQLLDTPGRDDFEPRRTDVFKLFSQKDIGIVTDVQIKPRGPGLSIDNWKMASLTVQNGAIPAKTTLFKHTPMINGREKQPFMIRADKFRGGPAINVSVKDVVIGEPQVVLVGNITGKTPRKRTIKRARTVSESYTEDKGETNTSQHSWSISTTVSYAGVVDASVTASYAGQVGKELTTKISKNQTTSKTNEENLTLDGEPGAYTFHVITFKERRVYGAFKDPFGDEVKAYKVVANPDPNMQTVVFRYVDEVPANCTNCKTFQEYWKLSGEPGPAPNGPKKPAAAAAAPAPIPVLAPAVAPVKAPVAAPTQAPADGDLDFVDEEEFVGDDEDLTGFDDSEYTEESVDLDDSEFDDEEDTLELDTSDEESDEESDEMH